MADHDGTLTKLAARLRQIDGHPLVLRAAGAVRRRLPGDHRYGDPLSLAADEAPGVLGQRLALLAAERPSALKEVGFSALQVWQSLSEAQGRGRGDEEVAILFTDLSGFSTWVLEAGDEPAVELLRQVAHRVEPAVAQRGGRVVKRLGDGVMAVFGEPESAVAAALGACQSVGEIEVDGYRPKLRAGVHVGRPRRLGGDYFGVDVNTAARIAASAGPQEVLISDAVRERLAADGALKVRRRWRFNAKGTPAETRVFAVEP
jgi:adenylate cyclase